MEIFELLEAVATTSLAALAIAAGTVVVIGVAVAGVAWTAESLADRRRARRG